MAAESPTRQLPSPSGWMARFAHLAAADMATILHLLGLDHTKLTYRHAGRDYRLTDVHGRVVHEILS